MPYNWVWFAEKAAGGIVGGVASEAFLAVFGETLGLTEDYASMFKDAVNEIETRVGRVIENEFVDIWIADANSVRSSLLTYVETTNIRMLESTIEPKASDLANRFIGLDDYRGLGGFMISANLHLLSIKFLSLHNEGYLTTLNRKIEEYSDWGEKANEWTLEMARSNVDSHCTTTNRFDPSGRPGRIDRIIDNEDEIVFLDRAYTAEYKYNWGKEHKNWYGSTDSVNDECELSRRAHYDQIVTEAEERYDQLEGIIVNWREGKIEL
jgi:hypothetical protein